MTVRGIFSEKMKPGGVLSADGLRWREGDISPRGRVDATEIPRNYHNMDRSVWSQASFLMLPAIQTLDHAWLRSVIAIAPVGR